MYKIMIQSLTHVDHIYIISQYIYSYTESKLFHFLPNLNEDYVSIINTKTDGVISMHKYTSQYRSHQHQTVWNKIIQNGYENALIIDNEFISIYDDNFIFKLNKILYQLPIDYFFISLDAGFDNIHADLTRYKEHKCLPTYISSNNIRSISSYVISNTGCKHLLNINYDVLSSSNFKNVYWAEPVIFDFLNTSPTFQRKPSHSSTPIKSIKVVFINFPMDPFRHDPSCCLHGANFYTFFKNLFYKNGYNIELTKDKSECDVLIGSVFGDTSIASSYPSKVKIFFTGEARERFKFNDVMEYYTHFIGFDEPTNNNMFRVPYWLWCFHDFTDFNSTGLHAMIQNKAEDLSVRTNCALIANTDFSQIRTLLFKLLTCSNVQIDCPSSLCNNTPIKIPSTTPNYFDDKINFLKNYKIEICFENIIENGYITEKIFGALYAGCIPVYWGSSFDKYIESKIINQDRIIRLDDNLTNLDYVIETICKLINDNSFFIEFASKPVFLHTGWKHAHHYMGTCIDWFGNILNTHCSNFYSIELEVGNNFKLNEHDIITHDKLINTLLLRNDTLVITKSTNNITRKNIDSAKIVCIIDNPSLNLFLSKIFNIIPNKIKLITINCNAIPIDILNNPKIVHLYTSEYTYTHHKISGFPYGLKQNKQIKHFFAKHTIPSSKNEKPLLPFIHNTNDYYTILKEIKNICNVTTTDNIIRRDYNHIYRNYKYIILPFSSNDDLIWECLYLNKIPIIQESIMSSQLFEDLPVILIEWNNIINNRLTDVLKSKIERFNNNRESTFNYNKLKLSFWIDLISDY